ncbi:thioredoxin domain-containing protein [Mycetocola zhadangensis]|uniref:thioredoxin domain-containing protein n=1 Tax=Mycetocola zhadangensis TaxID=1164595 RepID=UPI003A4E0642
MVNRLASAMSPYLRAHRDNPVDWREWGKEAFDEAAARDVPVFISIGYATCHWCHVMARESFSDPAIADYLNEHMVSIKVDREEHPAVDSSYLAQASAFTGQLGWPLSVFATPAGTAFFAGTYFPPVPVSGHPSFRDVLNAVMDAWTNRREAVEANAAAIGAAVASTAERNAETSLPSQGQIEGAVAALAAHEDPEFGGFGGAPKFPVAPILSFLLATETGAELGARTLEILSRSPLVDPVDGGFFRYGTQRDWSEPHYERMLFDNALLLDAYTEAYRQEASREWASAAAAGIARFLTNTLQLPTGGFASAQDSESVIDGQRSEGGYYARDAAGRAGLTPPALDEKVLAGWNGLAIAALARASVVFDRPDYLESARWAADYLLENHRNADDTLVRASVAERRSTARATLEDYGMLAGALLELSLATGELPYAQAARSLVDSTLDAATNGAAFGEPGGGDPVLTGRGIALSSDPSEGAYPSGVSATATAAWRLYLVTGDRRYSAAAESAMAEVGDFALTNPMSFGASLRLMTALAGNPRQLVVVAPDGDDSPVPTGVRYSPADIVTVVSEQQAREFSAAGFELFDARLAVNGRRVAYACESFSCQLPTPV